MITDSSKPAVLVTAVGGSPGLNALRAVVESGRFSPVAVDANPSAPGLFQFGVPHEILPLAARETQYLESLIKIANRHGAAVILPCIEAEVSVQSRHRRQIEEATGARLLLPGEATVAKAMDKYVATRAAEACGLPTPRSIFISAQQGAPERIDSLDRFRTECALPWIAKPIHGSGMRGVTTLTTLDAAMAHIKQADCDLLLQEKIPGKTGSMHMVGLLYDREGQVRRRFLSRSIKTFYPDGGPATAGVAVENPTLITQTEKLIGSLGAWQGPAGTEWMLDPRDQEFKFIEINPRFWGYGYLAVGAGSNFPALAAQLALGMEIGADPGYRAGVTMLRSEYDLIFERCPFELQC